MVGGRIVARAKDEGLIVQDLLLDLKGPESDPSRSSTTPHRHIHGWQNNCTHTYTHKNAFSKIQEVIRSCTSGRFRTG